jgi:acyl-CoA thioester hydrolase
MSTPKTADTETGTPSAALGKTADTEPGTPSAALVPCQIRVIYGDTDKMGVVYYANYFRYFEAGRNEYLRARGVKYTEVEASGLMLPVIEAHCLYRKSARYDDLLTVETRITEIHRASLKFEYVIHRDPGVAEGAPHPVSGVGRQAAIATGFTLHVCLGAEGKPTRIPPHLAKQLKPSTP